MNDKLRLFSVWWKYVTSVWQVSNRKELLLWMNVRDVECYQHINIKTTTLKTNIKGITPIIIPYRKWVKWCHTRNLVCEHLFVLHQKAHDILLYPYKQIDLVMWISNPHFDPINIRDNRHKLNDDCWPNEGTKLDFEKVYVVKPIKHTLWQNTHALVVWDEVVV